MDKIRLAQMAFVRDAQQSIRDVKQKKSYSLSRLAIDSGLTHTTLTRFVNNEVKHALSSVTLTKISEYSGVPIPQMAHLPDSDVDVDNPASHKTITRAQRIHAIRTIVWKSPSSSVKAAADLKIKPAQLLKLESGAEEPAEDFLFRFCALTGATLEFIRDGTERGLRLELVAWLGHLYPEMLPELLGDEDL